MLKLLSIKDFVIVDFIELELPPGFTVLTGETGAGKSIIIDALGLALGERGDANQIRHGCERAEINATFDVQTVPALERWLEAHDLQGDPGICLMRRILEANGRSRSYINGHTATLQQMRAVGEHLIAIHSQHAHQALLQKEVQRALLDAYADGCDLAGAVREAYQCWQDCRKKRIELEQRTVEWQQQRDQLEWQWQELSMLDFSADEWQTLQADHTRLSHVAALLTAAESGLELLSEGESPILAQLNIVDSHLQNLLEYDRRLKPIIDLLDAAQIQLREGVYELKHYRQSLDLDPQRLQQVEQRLSAIHAAARKFRKTPEELPELMAVLQQQLASLGADADIQQLREEECTAEAVYLEQVHQLSKLRQKGSAALARQVTDAMQTLAMAGGAFSVALVTLEQGTVDGLEQVEFQVTAHQGLPLRPLAKVASGGELSRISLAIQVITSKVGTVPTLIFDEVDVGIGGKVAEIVGQSLRKLAKERQVLCITHLPQVAANGDQHWNVSKSNGSADDQPVVSQITVLTATERIEEIARMLGGVNITETTRKHAAEMLRGEIK